MPRPEPVSENERTEIDGDESSFLVPEMLRFDNGATVILNPAVISDSAVSLSAVSLGGTSVLAPGDAAAATVAADTVTASGLGGLDAVEVDRIVGATSLDSFAGIDDTSEYITAEVSTSDLELGFQYLHQLMSEPRADQVALDAAVSFLDSYTDGGGSDQDAAAYIALLRGRYGDDPRVTGVPSSSELATVTTSDVERVWRDRFGNVGDWVFVVVGDFDVDDGLDLARRYIGTLTGSPVEER